MNGERVHLSPFAGSWYPSRAAELAAMVEDLERESASRTGAWLAPRPLAFVVPHAGLVYSGAVACAAYRHIAAARPPCIVLIGFSHGGGVPGVRIPDVDGFGTPLGVTNVDRDVAARLAFDLEDEAKLCDHSVEIQLPLLQALCPDIPIVPVYVNHATVNERLTAARELGALVRDGAVLVASSDFTHFGRSFGYTPFEVDGATSSRIADLDGELSAVAGSLDSRMFLDTVRERQATLCGAAPIGLMLDALEAAGMGEELFQSRLDYRMSGSLTGDFRHSVSYAALGYFPASSFTVSEMAGRALVESATSTLRQWQQTGQRRPVPPAGDDAVFQSRQGVFVSTYVGGELRGCIGSLGGEELGRAVPSLALTAALDDMRFATLGQQESDVEVEISLLTPMKRVRSRDAFRVDEHGALLERGSRRGLLLPQVATERGWDAETFLGALTQKAGLPHDVWDSPAAHLSVFRAQRLHS